MITYLIQLVLLSIINMQIRNDFSNFNEFCQFYGIEPQQLQQHMAEAGYLLRQQNQQFMRV
ncbi:MAG: DUF4250 domain-containing protein [Psychromonas sp.]